MNCLQIIDGCTQGFNLVSNTTQAAREAVDAVQGSAQGQAGWVGAA